VSLDKQPTETNSDNCVVLAGGDVLAVERSSRTVKDLGEGVTPADPGGGQQHIVVWLVAVADGKAWRHVGVVAPGRPPA